EQRVALPCNVLTISVVIFYFSAQDEGEVVGMRPEEHAISRNQTLVFHHQKIVNLECFVVLAVGNVVVEIQHDEGICADKQLNTASSSDSGACISLLSAKLRYSRL